MANAPKSKSSTKPRAKTGSTRLAPLPMDKVYALIEPGPVVLLATALKGRANVMTMSCHMMIEFERPTWNAR